MNIKFLVFVLIFLGFLYLPFSKSQGSEIFLQENDVEVRIVPENPEPYQNVTLQLVSYAIDLNKAMIEWRSGLSVVLSGYGKKSYSFQTLGPDKAILFEITIKPAEGLNSISKKISVIPSEMDVFWEAVDGYLPLFYKGKSLISRESQIKVVAIPNTSSLKQGKRNISYTWKKSGQTIESASGYNKDFYIFKNEPLNRTEEISVMASSIDSSYGAIKTINIQTVDPKIIFYKKSPTEGVLYNRALKDNDLMAENEMTIVAEPYFLAYKGQEHNFNYQWKINGKEINTPSKKTEITVKPSSSGGYATISLNMENLKTLYQEVVGSLKLNL